MGTRSKGIRWKKYPRKGSIIPGRKKTPGAHGTPARTALVDGRVQVHSRNAGKPGVYTLADSKGRLRYWQDRKFVVAR